MRLRIPPSKLDGREPAHVTEYEYDGAGQLIRSVTTRESEWSERDRAEATAYVMYEESLCPCGCGHLARDTFSPEDGGPVFVASRTICRARLALLEEQEAATTPNSRHTAARMWRVDMKRG